VAIYSLRLMPVGKTTQKLPFTAAAHIRYIARKEALSHHMAERMPEGPVAAARWLRAQEKADRKNARVADKLVVALPIELTPPQQVELVWRFSERLTRGRASWFAAIHAKGKDRNNPHFHLLVRDRDIATGERVVLFSAGAKELQQRAKKGQSLPTTLRAIRELWELEANRSLEAAGRSERIDHRRLVDQGIYRLAQIHEGPNIRAMHERGAKPASKERVKRTRAMRKKGTPPVRVVRYPDIDRGRTRVDYNTALKSAAPLSLTEIARIRSRTSVSPAAPTTDRSRGR
jgi:hypothetical protein